MINKKIASEIAIGIILLLSIAIGGIFYWQDKNQQPVINNQQSVVPVVQTPTTQPVTQPADETVNWQTYTEDKGGFEVKYPADWFKYENKLCGSKIVLKSPETNKREYPEGPSDMPCTLLGDIFIYVYNSVSDLSKNKYSSLAEYLASKEENFSQVNKVTVGGLDGYEAIESGFSSDYIIFVKKNEKIYKILFSGEESKESLKKTENQILSTFKFTDSMTSQQFSEETLKNIVFSAVCKNGSVAKNPNPGWNNTCYDKKIDIEKIDTSQKAAIGSYYLKDQWHWVAWMQNDGIWKVALDADGFNCKDFENMPDQYKSFFRDIVYSLNAGGGEYECF
jgi:hypothetical protein